MLLALGVGERDELSQEQGVFEDPLYRFDEVRLQRGRVLLGQVPLLQEVLKCSVCLGWMEQNHLSITLRDRDGGGGEVFYLVPELSAP